MNSDCEDLTKLRHQASRFLLLLNWLHIPIIAAATAWGGHSVVSQTLIDIFMAAIPTAWWWWHRDSALSRYLNATVFILQISFLVHSVPPEWQMDAHMYFYAAFALLACYCDWRTLLVASGVTAVHHLIVNFAAPYDLYPTGANLTRVSVHIFINAIETGTLMWLTHSIAMQFNRSAEARKEMAAAQGREAAKAQEQKQAEERAAKERTNMLRGVAESFRSSVGGVMQKIAESVEQFKHIVTDLGEASSESSQQVSHVSAAVDKTNGNMETVAAAVNQLGGLISNIGSQVFNSTTVSKQAVSQAERTSNLVNELSASALKVGDIVKLIGDIADQTNLLALNATIEAARAGETGRGFAVVANEVKTLATQTSRATDDIHAQISAIQTTIGESVDAIGNISETIKQIDQSATAIASAVDEQKQASQEISRSFQDVAEVSSRMSHSVTTLAGAADKTGQVSQQVADVAQRLQEDLKGLKENADAFVNKILAN